MAADTIRIQLYLARLGIGSRRAIEDLIRESKIRVNGKLAVLGQKVNPLADEIRVRNRLISRSSQNVESIVGVLNKPKGVVTTAKDPEGRKTVLDLLPKGKRLFPVGRLDLNTEGLLLVTNDGDLAYRLTHPQFEVPKVYEVKIRGHLDDRKIERLKRGSRIGEERFLPADILSIRNVKRSGTVDKHLVTIRLHEGKNRHVRRLFESVGCRVIKLNRIQMGPIHLKGLPKGGFRYLTKGQITKLKAYLNSPRVAA